MKRKAIGFTLAELLIALAILGVIATFTIPKIIGAAGNGQNTAIAKEAASMVSGAFSTYQLSNTLASGTTGGALTQYMNYVTIDSSTATTMVPACSATTPCIKLHNGGILQYGTANSFGGTATTNALYFNLDPDGAGAATTASFVQYYNGRLTTAGQQAAATASTGALATTYATDPYYIQNWN
jgi:prepilin-type N-terminal cleavage/methylation domain-containing protein